MKNACMFLVAAALVLPTGAVLADPPGHAKAWGHKDKQGRAYKKGYTVCVFKGIVSHGKGQSSIKFCI